MNQMRILALAALLLASPVQAQTVVPGGGGSGGGAPSGAAGGDLSGTYPNPTVGKISNLPVVAPTTWTPADASGAGLVFAAAEASYTRLGNMVFAYAFVSYPSTASGASAKISGLPVNTPAGNYSAQCSLTTSSVATLLHVQPVVSGSTVNLLSSTGTAITNVTMSGQFLYFICIYPAT